MKLTIRILLTTALVPALIFMGYTQEIHTSDLSPVAAEVIRIKKKQNTVKSLFQLFQVSNQKALSGENAGNTNVTSIHIDQATRDAILTEKPELVEIVFPTFNQSLYDTLQLIQVNLFSPGANHGIKYQERSLFYRGIIQDDLKSLVTLNVGKEGVSGILSNADGNIVIQPHKYQPEKAWLINSNKPSQKQPFTCHTQTEEALNSIRKAVSASYKSNTSADTVLVYFECDYDMFLMNNSSTSATANYLLGLFNEVSALYANESITLLMSDYFIWTQQDPYSDNSASEALTSFQNLVADDFDGDIAHLLSGSSQGNGGIAVINTLCNKSTAHSYSNIEGQFDTINNYSWDVHVVTHELGHNLGSPHTHECFWGPNGDEPLDNCATGGSCSPGPDPVDGGTIMSYCHDTPYGINFSLGFGQEPGDLIRSLVGSCPSLDGYVCSQAYVINESGNYTAQGPDYGNGATEASANHANWFTFSPDISGTVTISSCGQGVDTRLYLYEGSCDNLTVIGESDDNCSSGGGYNYASELINIPVVAGINYFIEWDDRWTASGFSFDFVLNSEEDPCENSVSLSPIIDEDTFVHSEEEISYDGAVIQGATLDISSATGLGLNPGLTINSGSSLVLQMESCQDYAQRRGN